MIKIENIADALSSNTIYNADIEPGKSIRLYGTGYSGPFDRTFKMGDVATYDSYNLIYMGVITGITGKTVTISKTRGADQKYRLKINQFLWKNWDFNEEKARKQNSEWMD